MSQSTKDECGDSRILRPLPMMCPLLLPRLDLFRNPPRTHTPDAQPTRKLTRVLTPYHPVPRRLVPPERRLLVVPPTIVLQSLQGRRLSSEERVRGFLVGEFRDGRFAAGVERLEEGREDFSEGCWVGGRGEGWRERWEGRGGGKDRSDHGIGSESLDCFSKGGEDVGCLGDLEREVGRMDEGLGALEEMEGDGGREGGERVSETLFDGNFFGCGLWCGEMG